MTPVIFQPTGFQRQIVSAAGPSYPTDGLVLCLDTSAASYPGTGTTWYDVSGNGYDFNTVNNPTWSSTDGWNLNGSEYLSGSAAATTGLNNTFTNTKAARNGLSIYTRITVDGTPTDGAIFAGWTASITKILFEINANDTVETAINTTPTGVTGGNTTGTITVGSPIVLGFEIASNGAITVYQNNSALSGTPATIPDQNFNNTTPWYRIGAREFPAGTTINFLDAKMKGLMIYNRALGATDRTSVYNYLNGL